MANIQIHPITKKLIRECVSALPYGFVDEVKTFYVNAFSLEYGPEGRDFAERHIYETFAKFTQIPSYYGYKTFSDYMSEDWAALEFVNAIREWELEKGYRKYWSPEYQARVQKFGELLEKYHGNSMLAEMSMEDEQFEPFHAKEIFEMDDEELPF